MSIMTTDDRPRPVIDCSGDKIRTKQSFKDECDINNLVKSWLRKGEPPPPEDLSLYGDFTDGGDFLHQRNQIAIANAQFAALPSRLRARFDNDPAELLKFALDPANLQEAVELGVVQAPEPEPEPAPTPPPGDPDPPPDPPPGE